MLRLLKRKIAKIKIRKTIKKSNLFDELFYLNSNLDVKKKGIDPLEHYLLFGEIEGRKPNPMFDPIWYLENNVDVKNSGISPFLHYIKYGKNEGREGIIVEKKMFLE